jgi:spermidine synthase
MKSLYLRCGALDVHKETVVASARAQEETRVSRDVATFATSAEMNATKSAIPPALFALTLCLSAALLFLIQPMFGKMVLPRFGGAPAVWSTCLVFFQAALLAGYAYAHVVSTWLSARRQVLLHGLVLLAPLVSLPIAVAAGWEPPGSGGPIPSLLGLLAASVGLPLVVVSTTAPLLQAWFARSGYASAGDPYFLYAASNAGSLLALVAYPLILEPTLPLSVHGWLWSGGYVLLICLVLACGAGAWGSTGPRNAPESSPAASHPHTPPPIRPAVVTARSRLHWLALAFVPSSLLLSVTLHLTTDVAAVPLLWVIPLAIYLATFVLAFGRRQYLPQALVAHGMPLVVLALVIVLISQQNRPLWLLMTVHLAAFFVMALVCHGELARLRPPAERLTEFYLWLSVGGILGGLFSALAAPLLFRTVAEYPLMIVAACLLRPAPSLPSEASVHKAVLKRAKNKAVLKRAKKQATQRQAARTHEKPALIRVYARIPSWQLDLLLPLGVGLLAAVLVRIANLSELDYYEGLALAFGVPSVICYLFLYRPLRFGLGIGALLLAGQLIPYIHGRVLRTERSFFGVHRITVDASGKYMQLVHGSTLHGQQRLASAAAKTDQPPGSSSAPAPGPAEPLGYYHRRGPAGDIFALPQLDQARLPIAVIGLGTGSLAAYAQPGQTLDFYEIDPVVQRIAEDSRYFTFLRDCRGSYRIILGDGRLKIGTAPDRRYGLIVLDAFTSDAVPLHLITREALELYLQKLADGGMVAFHVSNRYLDLAPVVARLAEELDLAYLVRADIDPRKLVEGQDLTTWVVLAQRPEDIEALAKRNPQWTTLDQTSGALWTDERANLFSAWQWRRKLPLARYHAS